MKKDEVEAIKSRLRKAYGLPQSEQEKWRRHIEELEAMVSSCSQVGDDVGPEQAMEDRFLRANRQLSKELAGIGRDSEMDAFFAESASIGRAMTRVCAGIEHAFELGSMDILELKLEQYEEVFRQLARIFVQVKGGKFHELVRDEEVQIKEELGQLRWL